MERTNITRLLELLDAEKIKESSDWVMCACPFAPWTHSRGTDSKPSFGVSVGRKSYYNCFACHRSGPLPMLVTALCMLKGKDNVVAREFVMEHEDLSLEPFEDLEKGREPLSVLSPSLIQKFCAAHMGLEIIKNRKISAEAISALNLHWDAKEGRLIFPVYDAKGNLVGFRGRSKNKDDQMKTREYSELQPKKQSLKAYGVWYGMHRRVEPHQKIILVEGEMDMVSVVQALAMRGGVWCAMGSSISPEQTKVIQSLKNPVLIFFDNDEAGLDSKRKLVAKLAHVKPGVFQVSDYQGCNDPDEIVRKGRLKKALESIQQIA